MLHLSAAVITSTDKKDIMLFTKQDKEQEICIALLSTGHEMTNLDIFIKYTQNVYLLAKGPGEVNLSGYFKLRRDNMSY